MLIKKIFFSFLWLCVLCGPAHSADLSVTRGLIQPALHIGTAFPQEKTPCKP